MLVRQAKTVLRKVPVFYSLLRSVSRPFRGRDAYRRVKLYCSLLPETVERPIFASIGASDGITEDPVSEAFLKDKRWRGLLIEPVPFCFQRLSCVFQDPERFILEQVAIGNRSGNSTFYYVDENAAGALPQRPYWFDQIGSFDKAHVLAHLDDEFRQSVVECTVEVHTLREILSKHRIERLHYLQIDTEGYDYEIVKGLDFGDVAPWAILAEHKHLSQSDKGEMLNLLRAKGYRVDPCGAYDYFAVHEQVPLRHIVRDSALDS